MAVTKNKEAELRPVYVNADRHRRVRLHAANKDISIREFVAEAIDNELKRQKA